MLLREYQQDCVDITVPVLQKKQNALIVAPTGSGKTILLSAIIRDVLKEHPNYKVLVLAHRHELINQNKDKFLKIYPNVTTSIVSGDEKDWSGQIIFAMSQTLSRYHNLINLPRIDLLVIDEAHHAPANGYLKIIDHVKSLNQNVLLLGVTATPTRGDKKGLIKVFDNCTYQIDISTLIDSGHLVRPITYISDVGNTHVQLAKLKTNNMGEYRDSEVASILDTEAVNEDVIKFWLEYASDRKTVVFCSTKKHAENVYNAFNSHGITAAIINGETNQMQREGIFRNMNDDIVQVLINVAVLTEGWDYPPVSCVVLLRMSSFKSTMIQMIGRGLRVVDQREHPDIIKTDCIVLDFGISTALHGSLEQLVDLNPVKGEGEAPFKICPKCGAEIPTRSSECPICGFEIEKKRKEALRTQSMLEIDMLAKSKFAWHEIKILNKKNKYLIANGFNAWSCVVPEEDHYLTMGGSNNRDVNIETTLIYKGDKLTAISKGNDFLYEVEEKDGARKSERWRHYPASDKQIELINKFKNKYQIDEYNKGNASAIIAFEFKVKKIIQRLGNML